jgi:hypothetical protein
VEDNDFAGNVEAAIRLKGKPQVTVGANRYENNVKDQDDL